MDRLGGEGSQSGPMQMPEGPGRVLVVDSDSSAADEVSRLVSSPACLMEVCGDAAGAISRVRRSRFDCAIIDVNLPDMPGYEVVPLLREVEPALHFIITTAVNSKDIEVKSRRQDIFFYYIKSFDSQELKLAVLAALEKSRRSRGGAS